MYSVTFSNTEGISTSNLAVLGIMNTQVLSNSEIMYSMHFSNLQNISTSNLDVLDKITTKTLSNTLDMYSTTFSNTNGISTSNLAVLGIMNTQVLSNSEIMYSTTFSNSGGISTSNFFSQALTTNDLSINGYLTFSNMLGKSTIYNVQSNIGFGISNPSYTIDINGNFNLSGPANFQSDILIKSNMFVHVGNDANYPPSNLNNYSCTYNGITYNVNSSGNVYNNFDTSIYITIGQLYPSSTGYQCLTLTGWYGGDGSWTGLADEDIDVNGNTFGISNAKPGYTIGSNTSGGIFMDINPSPTVSSFILNVLNPVTTTMYLYGSATSNNPNAWTLLDSRVGLYVEPNSNNIYNFTNTNAYQYYTLLITKSSELYFIVNNFYLSSSSSISTMTIPRIITTDIYTNRLFATGDITTLSDCRFKTNITEISNSLDLVCKLKGYYYNRLQNNDNNKKHIGFLAQEVIQVVPEFVDYDLEKDIYSIKYGNIAAILVEAIKDMRQHFDSRISKLEEKIKTLSLFESI
jgi:hypothetical protein